MARYLSLKSHVYFCTKYINIEFCPTPPKKQPQKLSNIVLGKISYEIVNAIDIQLVANNIILFQVNL